MIDSIVMKTLFCDRCGDSLKSPQTKQTMLSDDADELSKEAQRQNWLQIDEMYFCPQCCKVIDFKK